MPSAPPPGPFGSSGDKAASAPGASAAAFEAALSAAAADSTAAVASAAATASTAAAASAAAARLASRERARGVRSIGKDGQQKKAGERLPPKQQQKSMRIHHNKGLCIAKGSEGVQGDLRRERFQGCGRLGGFFGGRFLGARGLDCCGFGAHRFEVRRLLSQPHARWRE